MNADRFWKFVEDAREHAKDDGERAMTESLKRELGRLSPAELLSFQEHFDEMVERANETPLRVAASVINGGIDDRGFMEFRFWLIAQGQGVYDQALADPDSLASVCDTPKKEAANETYGLVAPDLYEEVADAPMPRPKIVPTEAARGEPWTEDDVQRKLPRLAGIHARA